MRGVVSSKGSGEEASGEVRMKRFILNWTGRFEFSSDNWEQAVMTAAKLKQTINASRTEMEDITLVCEDTGEEKFL